MQGQLIYPDVIACLRSKEIGPTTDARSAIASSLRAGPHRTSALIARSATEFMRNIVQRRITIVGLSLGLWFEYL